MQAKVLTNIHPSLPRFVSLLSTSAFRAVRSGITHGFCVSICDRGGASRCAVAAISLRRSLLWFAQPRDRLLFAGIGIVRFMN